MCRQDYLKSIFEAYCEGRISEEAYDAALQNIDIFCEEKEEEENNERK